MKAIWRLSAFWLLSFACSGCALAEEIDRSTCKTLARTYFAKPLRQTVVGLAEKPLSEQYAIYICGNQYMHPPALHLAAPFAAEGAPVATFLHEKLAATSDDLVIRDIVRVFVEMQRQHSYDIQSDRRLMAVIRAKSAAISSQYWREYVGTLVFRLEERQ